jgi:hypothetical protein
MGARILPPLREGDRQVVRLRRHSTSIGLRMRRYAQNTDMPAGPTISHCIRRKTPDSISIIAAKLVFSPPSKFRARPRAWENPSIITAFYVERNTAETKQQPILIDEKKGQRDAIVSFG